MNYLNDVLAQILEKVSYITQKGSTSINTYSANRAYVLNITFDTPFAEIPVVTASSYTRYHDGGYSGYLTTTVSNITTTGFTATIDIWCAYGTTTTVTWEASGQV